MKLSFGMFGSRRLTTPPVKTPAPAPERLSVEALLRLERERQAAELEAEARQVANAAYNAYVRKVGVHFPSDGPAGLPSPRQVGRFGRLADRLLGRLR